MSGVVVRAGDAELRVESFPTCCGIVMEADQCGHNDSAPTFFRL